MSMIMQTRRSTYQGDPGIFGAIWGGIKGAVGGLMTGNPLAVIGGAVKGAVQGGMNTPVLRTPAGIGTSLALPLSTPSILRINQTSMPGTGRSFFGGVGPDNPGAVAQVSRNVGLTSAPQGYSGYHLNKTGYWVNGSDLIPGAHYVAPGTKWVRNRRSNPLNPHALSRSLRRMSGFARATKHMRSEAGRVATSVAGPKRSASCGCKKKR